MSTLVLTVSGHSGGNGGPQDIYRQFSSCWNDKSVTVVNVDTIPDSVEDNVDKVFQLAQEKSDSYDKIYLVGYSMGGAVAAQVAQKLKVAGNDRVAGVALLSTQTDGLYALNNLAVPVLFYHGCEDSYFPLWQISGYFNAYQGEKKFVQVDDLGHDLSHANYSYVSQHYIHELAMDVVAEISSFFNATAAKKEACHDWIVTKKIPLRTLDRFINMIQSFSACKRESSSHQEVSLEIPEASQIELPDPAPLQESRYTGSCSGF